MPAFWNAEGVALKAKGRDVNEFRVEDYGAPPYPEVVLVTSRRRSTPSATRLARTLDAIAAGMDATLAEPGAAARGDRRRRRDRRRRAHPRAARRGRAGVRAGLQLDRAVLEHWADFDAEIGIVKERPDVERTFEFLLAG